MFYTPLGLLEILLAGGRGGELEAGRGRLEAFGERSETAGLVGGRRPAVLCLKHLLDLS